MKYLALGAMMLLPVPSFAQPSFGVSQEQMQQMMQQMQNMQQCMQKIDQSEMKTLEQRTRTMESEVKKLCAQGQRDEAQSVAMAFGIEAAKSPSLQQIKKCGVHMQGLLQKITQWQPDAGSPETKSANQHICDTVN